MTDPYASQADDSTDATIPLVPDAGYAATEPVPFAEDTLVDPAAASPWSARAAADVSAPGYGTAVTGYAILGDDAGQSSVVPAAPATPIPPQPIPFAQMPYGQTGYAQPQPPQTNYVQPQPPQTNYVQPQAYPTPQPVAPPQAGFAEPSGPADSIGTQSAYQGYPTAAYGQQPQAWPAVIHDPVGYDYGYSRQPPASDHPNAMTSLVLGIVGLAFFQVLSPVAWFMAAKGRREMAAYPGRWRNSGTLTAGLVLGIIGTLLLSLVAILVVLAVFAMMFSAGP